MKISSNLLLTATLGMVLAATSLTARAISLTDTEYGLLPSYCLDTHGGPGHTTETFAKWKAVMGPSFAHIHHYCWALTELRRAERSSVPAGDKTALRSSARGNLWYVINNAEPSLVLLPEVLTRLGRTELLLRNPAEAEKAFARARNIKPDYWPAYTYWAEFLLANGHKAEALTLVKAGLQHAPQAKALHELFRTLGGKPGDIPPPLAKQADAPVPESSSSEQVETPPGMATEARGQDSMQRP